MMDRLDSARTIRTGAERLRQLAETEASSDVASEMLRLAVEMDENAAELESCVDQPPKLPDDAVA